MKNMKYISSKKKNKILKLIFSIFLAFLIINDVQADDEYFRYGDTGDQTYIMGTTNNLSWYKTYPAYRFTFVDADGKIIANTYSYDLLFQKDDDSYALPWQIGGTYFENYKFGTSTVNKKETTKLYQLPSNTNNMDEYYMNLVLESLKKNSGVINLITQGTGNVNFEKGEFLVVEKLYTISIKTADIKQQINKAQLCSDSNYEKFLNIRLEDLNQTEAEYCSGNGANWASDIEVVETTPVDNYFTGTGLQILDKLNNTYVNTLIDYKPVFGTQASVDGTPPGTTGLYWIKNSLAIGNFVATLTIDNQTTLDDLETAGFNKTLTVGSGCTGTDFNCALSQSKAYGVNIFSYNSPDDESEPLCNNATNAARLGRAWNSKGGYCCLKGQKYNSDNGSCFTSTSKGPNDFFYGCSSELTFCSGNGIESRLSTYYNGGSSSGTLGPAKAGECILNNSLYEYDSVNKIYCSETLTTNFSNVLSSAVTPVLVGAFIPVNTPTVTVTRNCYKKFNTEQTSELQYDRLQTGVQSIFNNSKGPDLSIKIFDNYNFTSEPTNVTIDDVTLETTPTGVFIGETSYGEKYIKATLTTEYTYKYSGGLYLNKFVDIKTATGSGSLSTPLNQKASKTLLNNLNINVPTNTEPGNYNVEYKIDKENVGTTKFSNFLDLTQTETKITTYPYQESNNCAGVCTVQYTNTNTEHCDAEYSYLGELYGDGYTLERSFKGNSSPCVLIFAFETSSKDECDKAIGTDKYGGTLSATYVERETCYDYVNFENNSINTDAKSNICNQTIDIDTEDTPNNLVYRPIDLSNPFPGKDGSGRDSGKNWNTDTIQNYILSRQDTYSKTPLYSVTLTPSDIRDIRTYNDSNSYSDFNLECKDETNGSACYSSFIRQYLNTNKSVCANTNEQTLNKFNSCADYSKRQNS